MSEPNGNTYSAGEGGGTSYPSPWKDPVLPTLRRLRAGPGTGPCGEPLDEAGDGAGGRPAHTGLAARGRSPVRSSSSRAAPQPAQVIGTRQAASSSTGAVQPPVRSYSHPTASGPTAASRWP